MYRITEICEDITVTLNLHVDPVRNCRAANKRYHEEDFFCSQLVNLARTGAADSSLKTTLHWGTVDDEDLDDGIVMAFVKSVDEKKQEVKATEGAAQTNPETAPGPISTVSCESLLLDLMQ